MQQIAKIMTNKKFIPVILVLTAVSLFIVFKSQGKAETDDNPKVKYAKILRNVGLILEEGHFSPKKINDEFSKAVLKKFAEELDNDKNIFLQSDINTFKKYENQIDDEIHGKEIESFFTINDIYTKRIKEVSGFYEDLLRKPIDFSKDESVMLDAEKLDYPKTEAERKDRWRKRLKYLVLNRYTDMLDEREANKDSSGYVFKADSTLEREAREKVKKQMDRYFTTKKNRETMEENFSTFVNVITSEMDPHTNYLPPVDLRSFNESMSGRFYGIGAQLKEDDGKIVIATLVSGGPAWKSGELKENDEIIKVAQGANEPVDVTGYAVSDAVKLIRGSEKGSEVKLTIRRIDGSVKVISLLRDDIKLDNTFAKSAIINGEHKIGYIYLPEFYADFERPDGPRCADDVAKEIKKLKAENVEGIVLDLRGNGGGSLYDVVQMAGLFIEDGPICQVKGRDEKAKILYDKDKNILYSGPLAVMVDELSASASEIFAAAIQDYKRGVVIGSTSTYGKGTVQRNIPLNPQAENSLFSNAKKEDDLGSIKLTLQKFYRVNGGATQLRGVVPDIILPDRYDYLKFREKDNNTSLSWDEIDKAAYQTWTSTFSTDMVATTANDEVRKSSTFEKIRKEVSFLSAKSEKEIPLNLQKYRAEQKELKNTIKQLDDLAKLPKALDVKNIDADLLAIKDIKDKEDNNKQFIKRISSDIYIDETVKVMNNMIKQSATAKAE